MILAVPNLLLSPGAAPGSSRPPFAKLREPERQSFGDKDDVRARDRVTLGFSSSPWR
jgi:hypothetical protein